MTSTITPILVTRDVDRLHAFYATLLGATQVMRVPEEGPVFCAARLLMTVAIEPGRPQWPSPRTASLYTIRQTAFLGRGRHAASLLA